MDDLISRQEAMKICRRMVWNGADDYLPMSAKAIENEIRQLPPIKVCETAPSDLISRQMATDAMMTLQAKDDEAYGCHIPEGFDGERAKEALEQLPSVQQWIPISEAKPEPFRRVLVTMCMNGWNGEKEITVESRTYDGDYRITAWMPLPEPYNSNLK